MDINRQRELSFPVSKTVFAEIRTKYNTLSPAQKIIANYVMENSHSVILLSITDLAAQCETSETTILRFLKKLGYTSYQVFRVKMAQDIGVSAQNEYAHSVYEEIVEDDDAGSVKRKVIASTIRSIQDMERLVEDDAIERAITLMAEAKTVLFCGAGASSSIATDAHHKFLRLGLKASATNDGHMMSIYAAHSGASDLLFLISHSGESREIIDCARLARQNGAGIIALTSFAGSTLTRFANEILLSSTNETKYRSDAMVSRIVQLCIVDILQVGLILRFGGKGLKQLNQSRLAVAKMKT